MVGGGAATASPVGRQAHHGIQLIPSGGANPLAHRLGTALSASTATQSLPSGDGKSLFLGARPLWRRSRVLDKTARPRVSQPSPGSCTQAFVDSGEAGQPACAWTSGRGREWHTVCAPWAGFAVWAGAQSDER